MKKVLLVVAFVLAACGGNDSDSSDDPTTTTADTTVAANTTAAPETQPPATEAPTTEAPNPSSGTAAIILTIGDETWEFGSAQCAFVGATPGEEGSEWNVSNVKEGAQVYVSDDSFGPLVQYADISNGGDPNFNWESIAEGLVISVSGNDISVSGQFTDSVADTGPIAGTLAATCPGWFEG